MGHTKAMPMRGGLSAIDRITKLAKTDGFTNRDVAGFSAAYAMASDSEFDHIQVGAVIVYRGTIVGQGRNSFRSDPMQGAYNRQYREFSNDIDVCMPVHMDGIHAEMAAVKSIPYTTAQTMRWSKAKIYVYRISDGHASGQGLSRPCEACLHAIAERGIRHMYYSTDDGFAHENIDL